MIYINFDSVICHCKDLTRNVIKYSTSGKERSNLSSSDLLRAIAKYSYNQDAIDVINNNSIIETNIIIPACNLKEAQAKIRFLRLHSVLNNVVILPKKMMLSDLVQTSYKGKKNLLIDDDINAITNFINCGGFAMNYGVGSFSICMSITNLQDAYDFYAMY